ncbi:Calx-beta domain-containing protein [Deltaproteobacteria bacterium TL4]
MKHKRFTTIGILLLVMLAVITSCVLNDSVDDSHTPTPAELDFEISPISNKTSETGTYATFTVKLKQVPTHDVVLPVFSSKVKEGTVSTSSLIFTSENWNTRQIVTVTGVDDSVADGEQPYSIILGTVVTKDANYQTINPDDVKVVNVDDDSPGFTVGPISGKTSESGQIASFTVQIHSQPTANVLLPLSSDNEAEGLILQKELRFTPDNWKTPQTATVQGVDDEAADGNQRYHIILSAAVSEDPIYQGMDPEDVQVENIDNETPGITVSAVSGNTNEFGETATFMVRLNVVPSADVTVYLSSSDSTELTVFPKALTFTPQNWNAPQTITLTGVDDQDDDDNQRVSVFLGNTTSQDPGYHQLSFESVTVINEDNELPGFRISAISGLTTEKGGTATFTIHLNVAPGAEVVIPLSSSDTTEGVVSPQQLTFTPQNWNALQTVTVTGVDDTEEDGNQNYRILMGAAQSTDSGYQGLKPVMVTNLDDEAFAFIVSAISGETSETGETATFTVKLLRAPTLNVTIPLSSGDYWEGSVTPDSLTFTPNNWNAEQIVTVTGVDDNIADGAQPYPVLLGKTTSDDANYHQLDPQDVLVVNIDDETTGFTISALQGQTSEAGETATFTIKLNSEPTGDVVVEVASSDPGEGTVSPAKLTFTPSNWNANQTVTVTGIDDESADGNQNYTILLTLNLTETKDLKGYGDLNPRDVTVINTDNETAGFSVSKVQGNTTETGGTAAFTVKLQSKPTANVVLEVATADSTEGTVSPSSLSFSTDNWNANQTVTLTGINDDVTDGNQNYTIQLTINTVGTLDDSGYALLNSETVTVTNIDDDQPGFTISAISGNTTEATGTASFNVKLTSEPTGNVVMNVVSSDSSEGTVSTSSLTFTPDNWNANQTITVTGVNDDIADGNQSFTIQLTINTKATTDISGYALLNPDDVAVTNTDLGESAGFIISTISSNTTEDETTATFTVKLTSEPTANVVIDVVTSDVTEGTVSPSSITFTPANWNANQTITVTGVNDDIADGNQNYTVQLTVNSVSTADTSGYSSLNPDDVSLINADMGETSGFSISAISGNTTEATGTATFTVKLTSEPTGNVVIDLVTSDETEGVVTPNSMTFTPLNWNALQTIRVTGVDDSGVDGSQSYSIVLALAISSDSGYDGLNPNDVSIFNTDNDTAGFTLNAISGNTTEAGSTATFTIRLNSRPDANVVMNIVSSNTEEGSVSPSSVTFTNANWNANQIVTVTGADDFLMDGNQNYTLSVSIDNSSTSDTTGYADLSSQSVSVTNTDNDTAGFTISVISGNTTESLGTATFTVKLNSQPTTSVSIPVSSSNIAEGILAISSLTFTSTNWNANQSVMVTGVDDAIQDGNQSYSIVLAAASSSDSNYNNLIPADVLVSNIDNDSAGITISSISGNTTEFGGQATFTVKLNSQPTANVILPVSSSTLAEGTVSPSSLTFTNLDWNANQTVTITGVDDFVADGGQSYSIVLGVVTSSDSNYNNLNPADVSVTNTDNDSPGLAISGISGNTTESSGTATFTVHLNSQPNGNVLLSLNSSNTAEGMVSPTALTFTTSTWNANQNVIVTGVNDDEADGNQNYSVSLSVSSSSADSTGYKSLSSSSVSVINTDNDSAGFTLSAISGNTSEVGGTATFTARLNSKPNANVVLNITSSNTSEGTVSPSSLTFTTSNWSTNQTVIVTGVNDFIADGNQSYTLSLSVNTSSTLDTTSYASLSSQSVNVTNTDNDSAGFIIIAISGNTTESGGTATFTVKLNSQPTTSVNIPVSSSNTAEGTVAINFLTFTTSDWNTNQIVTVTGADDSVIDGNQNYSIVLGVITSSDSTYNGLNPSDVTITNIDNEVVAGMSSSMVRINAGTFQMGDSDTASYGAQPPHQVTLSAFYISDHEVTVGEFKLYSSGARSYSCSVDSCPVAYVSWTNIQGYITWLNQQQSMRTYRMCTEAEWEYAARAGTTTNSACSGASCINVAWYSESSGNYAHPVKGKVANAWGLYDMYGNMWESVADWSGSYSSSAQTNPTGPISGSSRVARGGGFNNSAATAYTRPATRDSNTLNGAGNEGFRLCASVP